LSFAARALSAMIFRTLTDRHSLIATSLAPGSGLRRLLYAVHYPRQPS
jgi:hypothetical protein